MRRPGRPEQSRYPSLKAIREPHHEQYTLRVTEHSIASPPCNDDVCGKWDQEWKQVCKVIGKVEPSRVVYFRGEIAYGFPASQQTKNTKGHSPVARPNHITSNASYPLPLLALPDPFFTAGYPLCHADQLYGVLDSHSHRSAFCARPLDLLVSFAKLYLQHLSSCALARAQVTGYSLGQPRLEWRAFRVELNFLSIHALAVRRDSTFGKPRIKSRN